MDLMDILTATKAEEEGDINESVADSENLQQLRHSNSKTL